ncbi:MAG: glycosyltransferase family 39 protein, partial [Nitrospinota bacterium]|nr:glycosyltransferase family 39 protein [Nitrospinota bacterium]
MTKLLNLSTFQIAFLLVLANGVVYGQVIGFEFVNFDDAFYVENVHLKNGLTWKGLVWAFSLKYNFSQFLNWISHMIDVELFGSNPAGHHAVSLFLHAANTVLFFLIMNNLTGSRNKSAIAAILFAVHPLRVETVAWVADRKDLLAMFFALLSLESYRRYSLKPTFGWYGLTAIGFLLALLSKPVMVVLPFVFLLMDYWPLNRLQSEPGKNINWPALRRLVTEKIPFFLLIGFFLLMIVKGFDLRQMGGKTSSIPLSVRLATMPVLYMEYLFHILWPSGLSVFYPADQSMPPLWQWGGSLILVLSLTGWTLTQWKRQPWLAVGWLWFAGSLLPMTGLFRAGDHNMADRYTYFPLIGIFIMVVWGLAQWKVMQKKEGQAAAAIAGVTLLALMTVSFVQTSVWKNNFTLYRHALAVDDTNHVAHNNLAIAWMNVQKPEQAVPHLKKAVEYCPHCIESRLNLGMAYKTMQDWQPAIDAFRGVLEMEPDNVIAHEELGSIYHFRGDGWLSIYHTRKAEAIYSKLFGTEHGTAIQLRQNLEGYYKQYFLR